jgi:hypothetical protein
MKPHVPKPSGDQTARQACNLGVLSFLYWCAFDGLSPEPTQEAVTAEFVAAGVPELAPPESFWEDLRRAPGQVWMLSPRGTDAWKPPS